MADYSGMTLEQLLELREKKQRELERLQSAPSAAPETQGPMQGPMPVNQQEPTPVEEPEPVPATETGIAPSYQGMSLEELQQLREEKLQQLEKKDALTFSEKIARQRQSASEAYDRGDYLSALGQYGQTVGIPTSQGIGRELQLALGLDEREKDEAPAFSEGSAMAMLDLLGNVKTQGGEALTSVGEFAIDPSKKISEGWQTTKDIAAATYDQPGTMALTVGKTLLEEVERAGKNPMRYVREKPIDVAAMALPGGGVRKAIKSVIPATGRATTNILTGAAGFFSRKGKGVFDEIVEATAEGADSARKQALDRFRGTGLGGRKDTEGLTVELAREVKEGIRQVKNTLNDKWDEGIKNVVAQNKGKLRHTMKSVTSEIDNKLDRLGIDVKALRADDMSAAFQRFGSAVEADHKLIKETLELVDGWTDNSIEGLHLLKRKIRSKRAEGKLLGASDGENAANDIWISVRERLSKGPDGVDTGYDKVAKQFEEGISLLEDTAGALSAKANPETVARKMINMFKDPGALDVRRQFINELEDATGKPLKAMVAGLESRSWVPQGTGAWAALLAGGGVGTGAAGTLAALTAPSALLILPFTSPKLMGGLGRSLGWSKKAINNAQDYVQNMKRLSKTLGVAETGASVGIMLERLMNASQERRGSDLLTDLGRANNAPYRNQSTQVMQ